jgi:hypothetical protein
LKTNAGPELLALWRETDGDITLTLLNGSADTLEELTVTLPGIPTVITPRWLLGEGRRPKLEGVVLDAGSLAPYEIRVLVFE